MTRRTGCNQNTPLCDSGCIQCVQNGSFEQGTPCEIYNNVFIERGTERYPSDSIQGKMQHIALTYARIWTIAPRNLRKAIQLTRSITRTDSHLYFPGGFGNLTSQQQIIANVVTFAETAQDVSAWIPENGWCLDTCPKFGRVNSGDDREFYLFTVEAQLRQTSSTRVRPNVTSATWSFFVDPEICKVFQIKEWLDGRVRILQNENQNGTPTLCLDYNNNNVIPWPPIFPGKENCLPSTTVSGCANLNVDSTR